MKYMGRAFTFNINSSDNENKNKQLRSEEAQPFPWVVSLSSGNLTLSCSGLVTGLVRDGHDILSSTVFLIYFESSSYFYRVGSKMFVCASGGTSAIL